MSGAPDQLVKKHEKKKKNIENIRNRPRHTGCSTLDTLHVTLTLEALTKSWTQKDQLI